MAIVFFSEGNKRVKAHLWFPRDPIIQRRRWQSQARQNQDKRIGARELHVYRSNNDATGTTATGYKLQEQDRRDQKNRSQRRNNPERRTLCNLLWKEFIFPLPDPVG